MDINEAMKICNDAGQKVYGVCEKGQYFVEVQTGKNNPYRYKKRLRTNKELNEAITATCIYLAKNLLEQTRDSGDDIVKKPDQPN